METPIPITGAQPVQLEALESARLERAKVSFVCRRVDLGRAATLIEGRAPRAGDLVLARVRRKRQHPRIELVSGRKSLLYVGDEVVLAYGHRYATDQFESYVPADLGPCEMVASGGIASQVKSRSRGVRPATEVVPIGLLGDPRGRVLNVADGTVRARPEAMRTPPVLVVAGSAMNAGKTTSAARIVHGLSRAGVRVGAAKVTGTGSGGDYWKFFDAGAHDVLDFTDAGWATTHRLDESQLARTADLLLNELTFRGCQTIVVEIADGLLQTETRTLLLNAQFRRWVSGLLVAVTDPLAADSAHRWSVRHRLPLLALCGTLTRSALAVREAVDATGVPALSLAELGDPSVVRSMMVAPPAADSAVAEA